VPDEPDIPDVPDVPDVPNTSLIDSPGASVASRYQGSYLGMLNLTDEEGPVVVDAHSINSETTGITGVNTGPDAVISTDEGYGSVSFTCAYVYAGNQKIGFVYHVESEGISGTVLILGRLISEMMASEMVTEWEGLVVDTSDMADTYQGVIYSEGMVTPDE
ncbi:MAG: hypothetical protein LBP32_00500, partial [Spirochaetaceae bacterium]|jgi:hypothetical protein|nr:hypothetical protein [Spirochaetaceae bacterium]